MKDFIQKNKYKVFIFIGVLVVCAFLIQDKYSALILALIGIYTIVTCGLDILFGYTGEPSFGHAAFFGIGAYASALLSINLGLPPLLTIFIGAILSTLIGILIAFPASKLVDHFLALLTIAFGQIVYMVFNSATTITGGAGGIAKIPFISIFGITLDSYSKCFIFIAIIVILVMYVKYRLIASRIGRGFIAIRENSHAANGLGIHVRSYKILAFAISAFIVGLAGGLYAHLVNFISPETFNLTQSILFITMLLFGGMGTFMGPVIGAVVLLLIKELFQGFASYQMLIYAAFIIVVLLFFPRGIVGILDAIKDKVKKLSKNKKGGKIQC